MDLVRKVLMERFGWESEPQIERAQRDGWGKNGKLAHVLVKMLSYQSKEKVLKARSTALEGSSIHVRTGRPHHCRPSGKKQVAS